jgi:hypothetical protein
MKSGLEVVAHPTGPWLVKAGPHVYAVPADLARPLLRWQGQRPTARVLSDHASPAGTDAEQWHSFVSALAAALEGTAGAPTRHLPLPIWLRLPLLPARWVRPLAHRLAPLTSGRGLAVLVLVGCGGYAHLGLTGGAQGIALTPLIVATAMGLFGLTAIWHELGHAAALARGGYPPGRIGAGLLFVIPVLFADVTAVGALPRRGRLRVDGAGVVFQFGLAGILILVGDVVDQRPVTAVVAGLALLAVGWSLFPFIRADGYWLMCDLLGLPDLESDPQPPPGPGLKLLLGTYRLANAAFLLVVGVVLPLRFARTGAAALNAVGVDSQRSALLIPVLIVCGLLLGLAWFSILRRVAQLVKAAW